MNTPATYDPHRKWEPRNAARPGEGGRMSAMIASLAADGYDAVSAPRNQTEKPPAQICTGAFPFMGLKPTSDTSGPRYAHQTPSRSAP